MTFFFTLIAFAINAWIVFTLISGYLKSNSTGFQRVLDAARGSWTILVAQLGAFIAAFTTASGSVLDGLASVLSMPDTAEQIKAAIASYVTPTSLGLVMLVYTLIVAIARLRTLRT